MMYTKQNDYTGGDNMKDGMISLFGLGLGGVLVPVIKVAFDINATAGILVLLSSVCLLISAGYFVINSKEDSK